jgi:hypothetical protein
MVQKASDEVAADTGLDSYESIAGDMAFDGGSESGWETVTAGNGEKIEFSEAPFVGRFVGTGVIADVLNTKTGDREDAPILKFEDPAGDPLFAWSTYQLAEALSSVPVGSKVRITHKGIKDIGGGRTVNRYKVEVASS